MTTSVGLSFTDDALKRRLSERDIFKVKLALASLSNRVYVCPVMVNLYLWSPSGKESQCSAWKFYKSGVPALVVSSGECGDRNPKAAMLCLVELASGFATWRETLSEHSEYTAQQNNFHTIMLGDGGMAGMRFDDVEAAIGFMREIELNLSQFYDTSSLPELSRLEVSSKEKIKRFRKLKKTEISKPCLFSHVTSINSSQVRGIVTETRGRTRTNSDPENNNHARSNVKRSVSMTRRR